MLQLHREKENGKSPLVAGGTLWGRSEIEEREKPTVIHRSQPQCCVSSLLISKESSLYWKGHQGNALCMQENVMVKGDLG